MIAIVCREDELLLEIEELFRGALLKINVCEGILNPIPDGYISSLCSTNTMYNIDCTFTVEVHTTNKAAIEIQHDQEIQVSSYCQGNHSSCWFHSHTVT